MKKTIAALLIIAAIVAGCTTTQVREEPPGSGNYQTNTIVDPRVTTTLETIGAVNEATKTVNPLSPFVTIAIAAAGAIAAEIARRKNAALTAVIAGVERAGSPEVKKTIQSKALSAGVEKTLNAAVRKVTGQ